MTKYTVQKLINFSRPNTFLITRKEGKTIYLSPETVDDYDSWISLISTTAKCYVRISTLDSTFIELYSNKKNQYTGWRRISIGHITKNKRQ